MAVELKLRQKYRRHDVKKQKGGHNNAGRKSAERKNRPVVKGEKEAAQRATAANAMVVGLNASMKRVKQRRADYDAAPPRT